MSINKEHILSYMNIRGNYGDNLTIDDFDITTIHQNYYIVTGTFISWSFTEIYYKDVVLELMPDIREDKFKELLE